MLIYFWMVLVISHEGFLEDLLGCSAICIICDSNHIVSMLKCMCSQNKVIHSYVYQILVGERLVRVTDVISRVLRSVHCLGKETVM